MRNGRRTNGSNGTGTGSIRCAVYCRKSTSDGLERAFTSLDNQRETAEAFIRSQQHEGWMVLPERYDDGGFSGGNTDGPALKRLLAEVEGGKVDAIVVYKLDRLSRSLLDFLNIHRTLEERGVNLVSVTEPINTKTPMGRAFLNILVSFGQMEREVTSERTKDRAWAARRRGRFVGGQLVLGFDRSEEPGKLTINETEAERVRQVFGLFLKTGSIIGTMEELARRDWRLKKWITKEGKTHGGGGFDKFTLRRLLTNHAYVGEVFFDGQVYPAEHPPIIDREAWDRVQALLREKGTQRLSTSSPYLLAGILRCEPCDAGMTPAWSGKNGRRYRYYTCLRAQKRGWASCPTKSVPARQIEAWVVDRLRAIGRDPALIEATMEAAREQLAARRRELETEIRDARAALEAAHVASRKRMTAAGKGRTRRLDPNSTGADIAALEELLAGAEEEFVGLRALRIDPADLQAALAAFDPVWEQMTSGEQQRIVQALVERIDYDGAAGKIAITFRPEGVMLAADQEARAVKAGS